MWELYDTLIENMGESETVEDFLVGPRWAVVRSSFGGVSIAPVIVESLDRVVGSLLFAAVLVGDRYSRSRSPAWKTST